MLFLFRAFAPVFHFKLNSFCWWGCKNSFAPGRRYLCYATDL